jgi:hypothetical protein
MPFSGTYVPTSSFGALLNVDLPIIHNFTKGTIVFSKKNMLFSFHCCAILQEFSGISKFCSWYSSNKTTFERKLQQVLCMIKNNFQRYDCTGFLNFILYEVLHPITGQRECITSINSPFLRVKLLSSNYFSTLWFRAKSLLVECHKWQLEDL